MNIAKSLTRILLLVVLVSNPVSHARPDGGYVSKTESVAISTDQRAILIKNGNEISMTFSTGYTGEGEDFGWIIPTPVPPNIGDVSEAGENWEMALRTLVEYSAPYLYEGKNPIRFRTSFKPLVTTYGQTALKHCEVSIIGAGDALALQSWLRENDFQANPAAQKILDTYIRQNWAFVAVKLNPTEQRHYENEFLSALTIKYRHDQLIFPLLIAAISTDRTAKISLYVVAESTATSSNLPTTRLRFDRNLAEEVDPTIYIEACIQTTVGAEDRSGLVVMWGREVDPWGKIKKIVQRLMKTPFPHSDKIYLTRLETIISPSSMTEDISIVLDSKPKEFEVRMGKEYYTCNDPALDPRGITLIAAAQIGDMNKVQELLRAGVNANVKCMKDQWNRSMDGWTPLTKAAGSGHTEIVQLLLQEGADVNITGGGYTALMRAALYGDPEIVRILLDEGADVYAKANNGMTALLEAAYGGHKKVINVLLEAGADVNAMGQNGRTALIWASLFGHTEIRAYAPLGHIP